MPEQDSLLHSPASTPIAAVPALDTVERDERRDALRSASYDEGAAALAPVEDGFLADLFQRMDANKDEGLDRDEIIAHLKHVKVKGGFLGLVYGAVASKFIEDLDTDRNERVSPAEFRAIAKKVLPESIFDEDGRVKFDRLDETFATFDADRSGGATQPELYDATFQALGPDAEHRKVMADVASKLGVDALDRDGDKEISRDELERAARTVDGLSRP